MRPPGDTPPLTTPPWVLALAGRWRSVAESIERYSPSCAAAATLFVVADDLEAAVHRNLLETLTLTEAAKEAGYSSSQLSRLIRRGDLRNVGKPNAPRVLRGHLPRKLRKHLRQRPSEHDVGNRAEQVVRAIANGETNDG